MAGEQSKPNGPDLLQGVSIDDIRDGGMVGGVAMNPCSSRGVVTSFSQSGRRVRITADHLPRD